MKLGIASGSLALANGMTTGSTMLTVMGIGLFFGAVGKSAQFPLHVWLPDAMEGPTPVSALIHAATMVAAGVYLVGASFPILTPDAKLFIAIIGCTTLTMAALIALAQTDIKKVLAYSTLSQLGYMIMAIGLGSYIGGLFHLITHAFFKALLFLGSGSVIHAAHHEQELPQYGGLIRKIPITGITFGIAVLAIAGTPFFSRIFQQGSRSSPMPGAFVRHLPRSRADRIGTGCSSSLPGVIAYLTPFYMMRCWMLTFLGQAARNQHVYDHAHETPILWAPLVVLAIFAVIAGYPQFGASELIKASITENEHLLVRMDPKFDKHTAGFATAFPMIEKQKPRKLSTKSPNRRPVSICCRIRSRPRNRKRKSARAIRWRLATIWSRSTSASHSLLASDSDSSSISKAIGLTRATVPRCKFPPIRSSASGCCGECISR